jgi:nitroreductase
MDTRAPSGRQADHPIENLFLERWSSRAFDAAPMSEAQLLTLLEASRWAPSSSNIQPWRFAYALRGEPAFDALAASLMPTNQRWAPQAAALVVVASHTVSVPADRDPAPNPHHAFDTGAAWAHLALQAHLTGWVAHAMGGFDASKAAAAVNLPKDYVIHAIVAVGRRGERASLPEALHAREVPNARRPLSETAFRGGFPRG